MGDSTGWAIVAIPAEDDYVWKISSEKVPHMTLLFLGQQAQNGSAEAHIAEYMQHIADSSLTRFGMDVDHRGPLGPDEADVLFFSKSEMFAKQIADVRSYLLKDETIFEMYNSTPQYEGWTPHLTLGYPATPAKKDDRDYGINWVNFDKIALWTGDYEGPTFELKRENWGVEDVAMSDNSELAKVLQHYGIKGMKWGVRRPTNSDGYVEKSASEIAKSGHGRGGTDGNPNTSADHERVVKALAKAKSRGLSSLSNEEIQAINKRFEAEKKFKQVSAEAARARRSTGRKVIDSVVSSFKEGATQVLMNHVKKQGEELVKNLLENGGLKVPAKSKAGTPFKVNPEKVSFRAPTNHNLPKLLKGK